MKNLILLFIVISMVLANASDLKVLKVDFLADKELNHNGAGPLLVKVDKQRNRIYAANTLSSSVSIIDGKDHKVCNIPVASRALQHLKDESFTFDKKSGFVYLIGNRCLHIVDPHKGTAQTIPTIKQFEMVTIDERSGKAYLVGRESGYLAVVDIKKSSVHYEHWLDREEALINLNQTPPPPVRKVVVDPRLQKIFAVDGYTSTLYEFNVNPLQLIRKRELTVQPGARWHWAGYNEQTHHLYLVVEDVKRKVNQAIKIDVRDGRDIVVDLPGFTEGVGINYNPKRDEIYIPYDNHPSVHVIDFKNDGLLSEIKIPLFGNDASAIDDEDELLYIASWAYGEIEIIDLKTKKFIGRIADLGIIPHTFSMDYNPVTKKLYIPIGATAVNGTFGAAVTAIDVISKEVQKIYTGWAPVDLIYLPEKDACMVFNSEDEFALVKPDGSYETHKLPFDYPHDAIQTKEGNIYLSYGPHQSYWPNVYIWGAKNGIMLINPNTFTIKDRRIPRLAQDIIFDREGKLYALQNSWGNENQFLTVLQDEVREFSARERIVLDDKINRETIQRLLKYDSQNNSLYIVKTGESDTLGGMLQIIDISTSELINRVPTGLSPTDMVFNDRYIYISNFDENSVTKIDKKNFESIKIPTGSQPLKLAILDENVYVINHGDNTLQRIYPSANAYPLPVTGRPDNITVRDGCLVLTAHSADALNILSFDPKKEKFEIIHRENYPYGETGFDTNNSSFYLRGQFGDCIYELNRFKVDNKGRMWITDFLSGKLFILN